MSSNMMIAIPYRPAKLRTKTGCLTCRNRRKKCDENLPTCQRCIQSNRECLWPTSTDLIDRRHINHHKSRYTAGPRSIEYVSSSDAPIVPSTIPHLSESVAHGMCSHDLEGFFARHFVDQFYGLTILPNCHPDFYNCWIQEIQRLMTNSKCVRYAALCNAASHLHLIESSGKMQELALTYYSKALRGLSDLLSRSEPIASSNSVLMSMILLYLHGCMGRGTYFDIPRHLNAASRVLASRLFQQTPTISNAFDRMAIESVLYQIFHVSTGLWSDETANDRLGFNFDLDFWLRAERLLNESMIFPGKSTIMNSPILGVPVALFRLSITVKQMYQGARSYDRKFLDELRNEIEVWEGLLLSNREPVELSATEERNHKHGFYKNASYLIIMVVSLLSEQLIDPSIISGKDADYSQGSTDIRARPPGIANPHSWQIQKAVKIVESYEHDDEWASCFIGNWAIYSLGFFMSLPEHVRLLRNDFQHRWEVTKFSSVARRYHDLQKTWIQRGLLNDAGLGPEGRSWVYDLPPADIL